MPDEDAKPRFGRRPRRTEETVAEVAKAAVAAKAKRTPVAKSAPTPVVEAVVAPAPLRAPRAKKVVREPAEPVVVPASAPEAPIKRGGVKQRVKPSLQMPLSLPTESHSPAPVQDAPEKPKRGRVAKVAVQIPQERHEERGIARPAPSENAPPPPPPPPAALSAPVAASAAPAPSASRDVPPPPPPPPALDRLAAAVAAVGDDLKPRLHIQKKHHPKRHDRRPPSAGPVDAATPNAAPPAEAPRAQNPPPPRPPMPGRIQHLPAPTGEAVGGGIRQKRRRRKNGRPGGNGPHPGQGQGQGQRPYPPKPFVPQHAAPKPPVAEHDDTYVDSVPDSHMDSIPDSLLDSVVDSTADSQVESLSDSAQDADSGANGDGQGAPGSGNSRSRKRRKKRRERELPPIDRNAGFWWADQWMRSIDNLYPAKSSRLRLHKGRTCVRHNSVVDLEIGPGGVQARVNGSRPKPYQVRIELNRLRRETWGRILHQMAGKAAFMAQLLEGNLPPEIEDVFFSAGARLFPAGENDIRSRCTCPDNVVPCKHVAAVHIMLAEALQRDPLLLFALRGKPRDIFLQELREMRGRDHARRESPAPSTQDLTGFWKMGRLAESVLRPTGWGSGGDPARLLHSLGEPYLEGIREGLFIPLLESTYRRVSEGMRKLPKVI